MENIFGSENYADNLNFVYCIIYILSILFVFVICTILMILLLPVWIVAYAIYKIYRYKRNKIILICSQNCNIIVKLEDITSIYVDHINLAALEMEEKYTICCTLRNETSVIRLGEYKNKEKCDEIMAEILLIYNEIMRSTIKGTTFIPNYYKLPYE